MNPIGSAQAAGSSRSTMAQAQAPIQLAQQQQQSNASPYISSAITGAQSVYTDNPVMSGIAAAQAIHESGLSGKPSGLARNGNNYFGIKGKGDAGSINMRTFEYGSKGKYYTNAQFAKYSSPAESFKAHQNLMNKPRYESVRNAKTIEEAAQALQNSGYATDPNYAKYLINTYNKYVRSQTCKNFHQISFTSMVVDADYQSCRLHKTSNRFAES